MTFWNLFWAVLVGMISLALTLFSAMIVTARKGTFGFLNKLGVIFMLLGGPAFFFYVIFAMLNHERLPTIYPTHFGMNISEYIDKLEDKARMPIVLILFCIFGLGLILAYLNTADNEPHGD
jgi:uncharacterized membrane protein